jgi:hypothetical protein
VTRLTGPAALASLALVVVTSTGCSVTNPQTTQLSYAPADGASALLSAEVTVASLFVAAADAEGPGNLVARVVNDGAEPATVQITGGSDGTVNVSVSVPPRSTVGIGPDGGRQVLIDPVGAVPGALIPMTVSLQGGESADVGVPVLDGTFEEYSGLVPTPSAAG